MTKPDIERIGILETKVENIEEKIDDLKVEIRENAQEVKVELNKMYTASCAQHEQLSKDINGIKKIHDNALLLAAVLGPILTFIATLIDWHQVFTNAIK